ncbi:MAG: helix-turn-helix transcriptional regulator, partial [Gammaproteobacteria bacterium]|nr:helix-turn-helix transcriptional regulator [Gammaproteobacteria bacterium]
MQEPIAIRIRSLLRRAANTVQLARHHRLTAPPIGVSLSPVNIRSDRVRELRLQKSWSQEHLADVARLNLRTVQRVESAGTASLRTRRALATALGIEPAELDVRDAAPAPPDRTPASNATGSWPTFIVGCHALVAALRLGTTLLDVAYAARLDAALPATATGDFYAGIADLLLLIGLASVIVAGAALVAAWPVRPARLFVAASILAGIVLELFLPPLLPLLAPALWVLLDGTGGTVLR